MVSPVSSWVAAKERPQKMVVGKQWNLGMISWRFSGYMHEPKDQIRVEWTSILNFSGDWLKWILVEIPLLDKKWALIPFQAESWGTSPCLGLFVGLALIPLFCLLCPLQQTHTGHTIRFSIQEFDIFHFPRCLENCQILKCLMCIETLRLFQ